MPANIDTSQRARWVINATDDRNFPVDATLAARASDAGVVAVTIEEAPGTMSGKDELVATFNGFIGTSTVEVFDPANPEVVLAADTVVIDYVPLDEAGQPHEPARVKGYAVSLESDSLLDEFRTGLVDAKAGDEKEIRVVYPADFGDPDLAGKERTFQVRVAEVKEKLLPEADDAFAKRVSDFL